MVDIVLAELVHMKLGVTVESPPACLTLLLLELGATQMFDDHVTIQGLLHVEGEVTLGALVLNLRVHFHHVKLQGHHIAGCIITTFDLTGHRVLQSLFHLRDRLLVNPSQMRFDGPQAGVGAVTLRTRVLDIVQLMHRFKVTFESLIAHKCQITLRTLPFLGQLILGITRQFFGFLKTQIMLLDEMTGIDSALGKNSVTVAAFLVGFITHCSPGSLCWRCPFSVFFPV